MRIIRPQKITEGISDEKLDKYEGWMKIPVEDISRHHILQTIDRISLERLRLIKIPNFVCFDFCSVVNFTEKDSDVNLKYLTGI